MVETTDNQSDYGIPTCRFSLFLLISARFFLQLFYGQPKALHPVSDVLFLDEPL